MENDSPPPGDRTKKIPRVAILACSLHWRLSPTHPARASLTHAACSRRLGSPPHTRPPSVRPRALAGAALRRRSSCRRQPSGRAAISGEPKTRRSGFSPPGPLLPSLLPARPSLTSVPYLPGEALHRAAALFAAMGCVLQIKGVRWCCNSPTNMLP